MEPAKQFFKYPSIQNSYNAKAVKFTQSSPVADQKIVWAALQKIHGANFSIQWSDDHVMYCRRKAYISKPIPVPCQDINPYFTQKFFNCEKLASKIHNKLADINKILLNIFPNTKKFFIFGEYFGGFWPGIMKQDVTHVQKGIVYSPDHHFYIFDILVANERWLSVKQLNQLINPIIPTVPVYKTGTFVQMLAIDAVFNSTIPGLLGLQYPERNTCEGVVIRPYEQPKHIIYKIKNDQFLQITNTPIPKQQKKQQKQFKMSQKTIKTLLTYLNVNRVASAYSKMPSAGIQQLSTEIVNDILQQSRKNEVQFPESIQKIKHITKVLKNSTCCEVAKYLKQARNQNVEFKVQKKEQKEQDIDINLELEQQKQ